MSSKSIPPKQIAKEESFIQSGLNISTTIGRKDMEKVYRDLMNPPAGTASLGALLDKIACEKQR
jgi:hypothetical protein